ncbi:hypothetical protein QUO05_003327 [Vibrio cholerae]|nr:hypothetical protein [Vibrio cholerae]
MQQALAVIQFGVLGGEIANENKLKKCLTQQFISLKWPPLLKQTAKKNAL